MDPTDYLDVTTHITADGVYFGDEKLPGVIESGSVKLTPGTRATGEINRLTVTFCVGPVVIDDPIEV